MTKPPTAAQHQSSHSVLSLKSINKSFGGLVAARNISVDLYDGEIHALIGPNGAGKTTLINQIVGKLTPDTGSIHFNGQDVSKFNAARRARAGMGRTFQISALAMDYGVLENAMLGALGQSGGVYRFFRPVMAKRVLVKRAMEALDQVGLAGLAGAKTAELSHGQRRLLEVAVALALSPKALLMDEPMAGMGAEASSSLIQVLSNLRQQVPILLIEHDMDAVFALADRISVLVSGEIIASGSVADIRANPLVRQAYLGDDTVEQTSPNSVLGASA